MTVIREGNGSIDQIPDETLSRWVADFGHDGILAILTAECSPDSLEELEANRLRWKRDDLGAFRRYLSNVCSRALSGRTRSSWEEDELPPDADSESNGDVPDTGPVSLVNSSQSQVEGDESLLQFLEPIPFEPEFQGFARLLRGELLGRLGKADQALAEIDAVAKATPAPPVTDVLEARVAVLIRSGRFDDALKAVASGHVDEVTQSWLALRVRLGQRASRPSEGARTAIDSALFAQVKVLRESGRSEARLALIALAWGLSEPEASQGPDAWDAVAEGALTLGDLARAGALEVKGAARAEALGMPDQAAALRPRAAPPVPGGAVPRGRHAPLGARGAAPRLPGRPFDQRGPLAARPASLPLAAHRDLNPAFDQRGPLAARPASARGV